MTNFKKISASEYETQRFYQLPKFLFEDEYFSKMSTDAKVMYSLLKDRFELSRVNNWIDKSNNIYLLYTNKQLCSILQYAEPKIIKLKKELEKYNLILNERQGLNKPNRIYLLEPSYDKELTNSKFQNKEIVSSRTNKKSVQELTKSKPNDTELNDTDISETELNNTTTTNEDDLKQTDYKEKNISGGGEISKETLFNTVQQELNVLLTPKYKQNLQKLAITFNSEVIAYAIEYAANYGNNPKQYLLKILENWKQAQIKTLDQAQSYTHIKTKKVQNVNVNREMTPQWLVNRKNLETNELQSPEEEETLKRDREALLERLNNK